MANTVTFSSTETDICIDGLWQYDIGQTLDIMGLVPTGTPEIHWAYSALADLTPPQTIDIRTMTEVTTGEGEAAETYYTVDIPDLALSTADEVVGYVYDEGTGTGETTHVVRFYPEPREKPEDYAGVNDVVTLQDLIETAVDDAMPTFEIGEVEAGEAPAAELVETETGYALDLTLQTGPTGPQGPTGPTGPQGPTGPTGPAGADGESIDVVEISEADYLAIETPDIRTLYLVDCPIHVISVALDSNAEALAVLATVQLTASILPLNAEDKSVVWSSSDEDVATVDQTGLVTIVGEGEAVITVTTNDGDFTDTCAIVAASNLPKLWQGTRAPFTISGNRITVNASGVLTTSYGYSDNTTNLDTPVGTWITLNNGDKLKYRAVYVSGSKNTPANTSNFVLNLHPYALGSTKLAWSSMPVQAGEYIEYEFTASGTVLVTGLYGGTYATSTFDSYIFDIELYYKASGAQEYTRWI
jgi:hypothetical protein